MKKIISILICFNLFLSSFACCEALFYDDELVENLDNKLKIQKYNYETIKDDFVLNSLDKNLTINKKKKINYEDNLLKYIDKTKLDKKTQYKNLDFEDFNIYTVKISPIKRYSTKNKLQIGEKLQFRLIEDVEINNVVYKKGTILTSRVETISLNSTYGVPADLVVGNFKINNTKLDGQIIKQGSNRTIWVYPTSYFLSPFFGLGLLVLLVRGGHAKLSPNKIYEVEI